MRVRGRGRGGGFCPFCSLWRLLLCVFVVTLGATLVFHSALVDQLDKTAARRWALGEGGLLDGAGALLTLNLSVPRGAAARIAERVERLAKRRARQPIDPAPPPLRPAQAPPPSPPALAWTSPFDEVRAPPAGLSREGGVVYCDLAGSRPLPPMREARPPPPLARLPPQHPPQPVQQQPPVGVEQQQRQQQQQQQQQQLPPTMPDLSFLGRGSQRRLLATDVEPPRGVPQAGDEKASQCEAMFETSGFRVTTDVCPSVQCRANLIIRGAACELQNVLVDGNKVSCALGGESIRDVMGRAEGDEFPKYARGAMAVQCPYGRHESQPMAFHVQDMISAAMDYAPGSVCASSAAGGGGDGVDWVTHPTLFVTRYEYANLYHTMTDWFNAYHAWKLFGLGGDGAAPPHVLFFDGHSQGALDGVWNELFTPFPAHLFQVPASGLATVKRLRRRVCFKHAVIVPAGYSSPLSVQSMQGWTHNCVGSRTLSAFRIYMLGAVLGRRQSPEVPSDAIRLNVLFVLRKGYLAHPRLTGDRATHAERTLVNAEMLVRAVEGVRVSPRNGVMADVRVKSVFFEELPSIKEQLALVADTDVMIGPHGAGLSYSLFMRPGSALIEITASAFAVRQHFRYFAAWSRLWYVRLLVPSHGLGALDVGVQELLDAFRGVACKVLEKKQQ